MSSTIYIIFILLIITLVFLSVLLAFIFFEPPDYISQKLVNRKTNFYKISSLSLSILALIFSIFLGVFLYYYNAEKKSSTLDYSNEIKAYRWVILLLGFLLIGTIGFYSYTCVDIFSEHLTTNDKIFLYSSLALGALSLLLTFICMAEIITIKNTDKITKNIKSDNRNIDTMLKEINDFKSKVKELDKEINNLNNQFRDEKNNKEKKYAIKEKLNRLRKDKVNLQYNTSVNLTTINNIKIKQLEILLKSVKDPEVKSKYDYNLYKLKSNNIANENFRKNYLNNMKNVTDIIDSKANVDYLTSGGSRLEEINLQNSKINSQIKQIKEVQKILKMAEKIRSDKKITSTEEILNSINTKEFNIGEDDIRNIIRDLDNKDKRESLDDSLKNLKNEQKNLLQEEAMISKTISPKPRISRLAIAKLNS